MVQHSLLLLGFRVDSSIIPFSMSDHKPILVELSMEKNLGPIPFRPSPSWIKQEAFRDIVRISMEGSGIEITNFVFRRKDQKTQRRSQRLG